MDRKDELADKIVHAISGGTTLHSYQFSQDQRTEHQEVVGALKSLAGKEVVSLEQSKVNVVALTDEGVTAVKHGSPEARLWALLTEPKTVAAAEETLKDKEVVKIGMSQAMKNKWIKMNKSSQTLERATDTINDEIRDQLRLIQDNKHNEVPVKEMDNLKRRKLCTAGAITTYNVTKGPKFSIDGWKVQYATEFTAEMLESGSWKSAVFKPFNFNSLGVFPDGGHLHPLQKVRAEFRNIFLELGFEEMPTNNYVESSFWNFDSLFQPQSHPARDAHDTFFIADPATTVSIPTDYLKKVKEMHEVGGHGSYGYRYDWKEAEARKNLLRTHTTAVSSRMLHKLAQQKEFTPKKYFSIDRVFRNESLDATHLAEFHQVEGLVADRNLTLPDLIGCISQFFAKWGITDIKFKPAYNPYTEPSMEIFAFHPQLNKLVEIGNSGIFRPEMLLPMGLPADVRVIAWGLSLERPTMIKYGLKNIRDLEGNKVDLAFVENNPICRLGE